MRSASRYAFKDISAELGTNTNKGGNDNWFVTPSLLETKETRHLNKELGVNKVNYFGNTNSTKS